MNTCLKGCLLLVLFVSLVACGEGRRSSSNSIVGTWDGPCSNSEHNVYVIQQLTFAPDGLYRNDMRHFRDAQCAQFVEIDARFSSVGIYTVGKEVSLVANQIAIELDIQEHKNNHATHLAYTDTTKTIYRVDGDRLFLGVPTGDESLRASELVTTYPYRRKN